MSVHKDSILRSDKGSGRAWHGPKYSCCF